jgi:hypothetical protein
MGKAIQAISHLPFPIRPSLFQRPADPPPSVMPSSSCYSFEEPSPDLQVGYNVHFNGKVLWFLEMIYQHSRRALDRS